jgi:hypothetical protein
LGDDLDTMCQAEWNRFLFDYKLVSSRSKFCKAHDMESIFNSADVAGGQLAAREQRGGTSVRVDQEEVQNTLNHSEFMTALVRLAINKYILTGEYNDVSNALQRLLEVDIQARARPKSFVDTNTFRRAYCYTEETTRALTRHKESLNTLFRCLSCADGADGPEGLLLSLHEWRFFTQGLEMNEVDPSDATLCFAYSRMAVSDGRTQAGHRKASSLSFEGFLEALVRLAALKVLPTDVEIEEANAARLAQGEPVLRNAAEWLHRLQGEDLDVIFSTKIPMGDSTSGMYDKFIEAHTVRWGDGDACEGTRVSILPPQMSLTAWHVVSRASRSSAAH